MSVEVGPKQAPWAERLVPGTERTAVRRWPALVPEDELRIGVVGCGYWGAKHARVLTV